MTLRLSFSVGREQAVVDGEVGGEDRELLDLGVGLERGVLVLDDGGDALEHLFSVTPRIVNTSPLRQRLPPSGAPSL